MEELSHVFIQVVIDESGDQSLTDGPTAQARTPLPTAVVMTPTSNPPMSPARSVAVPQITAPSRINVSSNSPTTLEVQVVGATNDSEFTAATLQVDLDPVSGEFIGSFEQDSDISVPDGTFSSMGNGIFLVESTASTAAGRQVALNKLLNGGIIFRPTKNVRGDFPTGITVLVANTKNQGT